jgi:competence protein ComEA
VKTNQFKEYFTFSRRDQRGIILLSVLLLLAIAWRIGLVVFYKPSFSDVAPDSALVSLFKNGYDTVQLQADNVIPRPQHSSLFSFDPNKASKLELEKLGLNVFQVSNIVKYREKGGKFHTANDLKKIYGFSTEDFERIAPFILIEKPAYQDNTVQKVAMSSKINEGVRQGEINTMSPYHFFRLGIDTLLSFRIVKYRDLLGGYYDFKQLNEVYGMDSFSFQAIKQGCLIDKSKIQKFRIDTMAYKDLLKHPYLEKFEVDAIVHYKKSIGSRFSPSELHVNRVISEKTYHKIFHYIDSQ